MNCSCLWFNIDVLQVWLVHSGQMFVLIIFRLQFGAKCWCHHCVTIVVWLTREMFLSSSLVKVRRSKIYVCLGIYFCMPPCAVYIVSFIFNYSQLSIRLTTIYILQIFITNIKNILIETVVLTGIIKYECRYVNKTYVSY